MYERIVVALDGSPIAEQVLPHVEALAEKFASRLILVEAVMPIEKVAALVEPAFGGVPLDPTLIEETIETEEEQAETYLANVANSLRLKGVQVDTEHHEGPAVDVIVGCAERRQADLIGLTTRGRGGLSKLVFGSVAESVLKKAPCPTLLVRAR